MARIVIVEDDVSIAEMLEFHMRAHGYETLHFAEGKTALAFLLDNDYDLVLLDIMLPGCNGLDICKTLRHSNPAMPILILTAMDSEVDRVIGLELGADDYLTKPFGMRECVARVKALLRRSQLVSEPVSIEQKPINVLQIAELHINENRREVTLEDKPVELTAREFELLVYLAHNEGHVYSRSELLDTVWGYHHDSYEHTINTHINRLRNKLKRAAGKADFIQTVWGVGYKFVASD